MGFWKLHGIKPKKCHYMCIGRNTGNEKYEFDNFFYKIAKKKLY